MSTPVRIACWNLAKRVASQEMARSLRDDHASDVVVLPEYRGEPPADLSSWVVFETSTGAELAVATYGPWTATAAEVGELPEQVIGAVNVEGPVPFALIAVWSSLSDPKPSRNPVAGAITDWSGWYANRPLVVAGDWNTGAEWSPLADPVLEHTTATKLLDTIGLVDAFDGDESEPTFFHSSGSTHRIDHVWLPGTWKVNDRRVGDRDRSDHTPVIVCAEVG